MKKIIYQVLPRLFGNINERCVKNGTIRQNGCGKLANFTPRWLTLHLLLCRKSKN